MDGCEFDASKNQYYVGLLQRAKRHIQRLANEQHIQNTLSAQQDDRIVKQDAESLRSKASATKCKLAIQDCLKQCEDAQGHRRIPDECFDEEGEIMFDHIACCACNDADSSDANDILLCDGEGCNRAYHVNCLPLLPGFDVEQLDEESGWLCPSCDCRYDILWELSYALDKKFDDLLQLGWQDIFQEERPKGEDGGPTSRVTILNIDFTSEDESDDEDFQGEKSEGADADSNKDGVDGSDSGSDSESDDDEAAEDDDKDGVNGKGLEGEEEGSSEKEACMDGSDRSHQTEEPAPAPVFTSKRARKLVDYRALNDEMFGGSNECYEGEESDEDFVDTDFAPARRRAKRVKV